MGWDEALFGWLARHLETWRARLPAEQRAWLVEAEPMLPRLKLLASAVAGQRVDVAVVEGDGGIAGHTILLPRRLAWLSGVEANAQVLVARTVFAAMAVRDGRTSRGVDPIDWLLTVADLSELLAAEFPGWTRGVVELGPAMRATRPAVRGLTGRAQALEALTQLLLGADPSWLQAQVPPAVGALLVDWIRRPRVPWRHRFDALGGGGDWLPVPLWGSHPVAAEYGSATGFEPQEGAGQDITSERKSRPRPPPRKRRVLEDKPLEENPFTHSFEKVHTAEEYKGGQKRADGDDELDEHGAALDELDLDEVVLSNERTRSVYHADLAFSGQVVGASAVPAGGLHYDEWNARQGSYLQRWCRLSVDVPQANAKAGAALRLRVRREQAATLARVRAELARLETGFRWHTRQPDGREVDVDALIDRHAALAAGHEGPQRLYIARRRRSHDLAVLLLLDASMSTDGWVAGQRVLDVERDATVLLGEVLQNVVAECAIGAFHSFSREDCRFQAIKSFHEPWEPGLNRLASLEPSGYTRMGPAMRHGTECLGRCHARRKLMILLTDGKPSDTDHYEGGHGQADVRQAIREARQRGVQVFALSVDPTANRHLPSMFGHHGWAGLTKPGDLGHAVVRLIAQFR